jgi:hypothetical protein
VPSNLPKEVPLQEVGRLADTGERTWAACAAWLPVLARTVLFVLESLRR